MLVCYVHVCVFFWLQMVDAWGPAKHEVWASPCVTGMGLEWCSLGRVFRISIVSSNPA